MKEYRVTKYDPRLRDQRGAFTGEDWISVTQIGQSFSGVVLTDQEYKRVEQAYVDIALAFLKEGGVTMLKVEGLENSRSQPLTFGDGSILGLEQLSDVIREILREQFWCRLEAENGFLHFGWEYYMYIGVAQRCIAAERKAADVGLYVEELVSPYRQVDG
jgi:hypothetical protein